MVDLEELDLKLHASCASERMRYGECVRWIGRLREELVEHRNAKRLGTRLLDVLQMLYERRLGGEESALGVLREHGRVAKERVSEPPLDVKRKEFMALYRKSGPKERELLASAAREGGDSVLVAEMEKV